MCHLQADCVGWDEAIDDSYDWVEFCFLSDVVIMRRYNDKKAVTPTLACFTRNDVTRYDDFQSHDF